MNTTDQAFIRAYGSDFVPSNADEAARAADYPALANSNVNAVFGSLPQKHYRVDGPATTPADTAPAAVGGAPAPMAARPYVPQPALARPFSPAPHGHDAPRQYAQVPSAAVEPQVEDSIEQEEDRRISPQEASQETLPPEPKPVATHARVPRPHLNFAAVKNVEPQPVDVEPQAASVEPLPADVEPQAADVESQAADVEPMAAPEVDVPREAPAVIAPKALSAEDGLIMLADSSVVIASSVFEWPTNEPAATAAPTVATVDTRATVEPQAPLASDQTSALESESVDDVSPSIPTAIEPLAAPAATIETADEVVADQAVTDKVVTDKVVTDEVAADDAVADKEPVDEAAIRVAAPLVAPEAKAEEPSIEKNSTEKNSTEESGIEETSIEEARDTETPQRTATAGVFEEAVGATEQAEVSQPTAVAQTLKPAWEVDRLLWPADADHLYESESEYFRHAGEKLRGASQEGLRVLGVSSSHHGEGCTTLAICLARAAAAAGAKVALLDANLRSPQLGAALGLDFAHSWHETLNGTTPLAEAAVSAIADNVTLLPLSKNALHQGLTLDSDAVNEVLRQASETFDLVLVDVGSLSDEGRNCFQAGDACPLDAAIIVRDVRTTSEEETLESVSRFRALGIDAVGVAENFASSAVAQAAA